MLKKILLGVVVLVVLVAVLGGGFVLMKTSGFDSDMAKVWDIPLADVKAPDLKEAAAFVAAGEPAPSPPPVAADPAAPPAAVDPAAAAKAADLAKNVAIYKRGKHLAESIGACLGCHGPDLATPEVIKMGPVATVEAPNISMGGMLKDYSDAQLHRLLVHGVKNDGRSVLFMPIADFRWWPDADIVALTGFLRTMPAIDKPSGKSTVGTLGKVLDQTDKLPFSQARRVAGKPRVIAGDPAPTVEYGKHLGNLCIGCHGETLSGGPIPGAPSDLPIPKNITKHASGIAHYDYAKFETLIKTRKKADGTELDKFMPTMSHMNETEIKALWAYLESVPAKDFGGR